MLLFVYLAAALYGLVYSFIAEVFPAGLPSRVPNVLERRRRPFRAARGAFHKTTAMLILATASRVFADCNLPANPNIIPVGSAKGISCDTSFPASQVVSMQAMYNGGYPNYDVFLTSGPSCSILPSDSSFRYDYTVEIREQSTNFIDLPERPCGLSPPCCVIFWCRNNFYECRLKVNYRAYQPPASPSSTPTSTPTSTSTPSSSSSTTSSSSFSSTLSASSTPTFSPGAPPSLTSTPGLAPTSSPTPSLTSRPSATPQFSRSTCSYNDTFSLPATSQRDNYMFLTCAGPRSATLPYYASARMFNPNACNISLVGSADCDINPVTNSPSKVVGLFQTTALELSFSELYCGTRNLSCCIMLWTANFKPCKGLGLAWSVQQIATLPQPALPPAPPAAATTPTIVAGLPDAIFWGIIGGGGLCSLSSIYFLCGRCKRPKSASTTSWEAVGTTTGSTPAMAPTSNPLHTSVALRGAAAGMALAALSGAGGLELVSESAAEVEVESQSVLTCVCRFVVDFVIGVIRVLWNFLQSI